MYNIKQASLQSGVSVPLIRAWERRYGVVSPKRTAAGYRLYDEEAIATLSRVRELTALGWSASEASRAVLAGEVAVDGAPTRAAQLGRTDGDAGVGADDTGHPDSGLRERFLDAAVAMDAAGTATVLDEMFAQGSFETVVDGLLMPALVALGSAWADGRADVAAEHAASSAVLRRLAALYEAAGTVGDPTVVVGLPPGGRHELGALAFAVALRRLGVGVLYLGADVPAQSWVHVARQHRVRLVVLAVAQEEDRAAALEVAEALREARAVPLVAVGGRSASWDGGRDAGMVQLPDRIDEAAAVAARLAATGGTSR